MINPNPIARITLPFLNEDEDEVLEDFAIDLVMIVDDLTKDVLRIEDCNNDLINMFNENNINTINTNLISIIVGTAADSRILSFSIQRRFFLYSVAFLYHRLYNIENDHDGNYNDDDVNDGDDDIV